MLGIGFAPVFFRSLFFMAIIFVVMIVVMEEHRKPKIQDESKVKALIPQFSTGNFLQNLEYQLRMIHMADTAEQVRFFAVCDLTGTVERYQNVVDCCICGVRFLKAEAVEDRYRLSVEVKMRLTQDTGSKIRNRYEKLRLELEGRQEIVTQHGKALREYKCPNCGGSVDILGGGVCDSCNVAVDYRNFGWIITSYTNLGQPENQPTAPISIDFASLKSINDDVIGWIYMEALPQISYPVVQGEDNNTYLHQTYEKNYNFAGTIFIDYENKRDFSDCNTLVYGHNMKNGSMFGMLKKYRADETLYNTSKYFWILTPEKNYRYEIIAAYTTSVNSETYTLFKGPGSEFLEYEKKMFQNSEIQTDASAEDADVKDKIVTLSTCTGNQATRFVVQGKRVNAVDPQ